MQVIKQEETTEIHIHIHTKLQLLHITIMKTLCD